MNLMHGAFAVGYPWSVDARQPAPSRFQLDNGLSWHVGSVCRTLHSVLADANARAAGCVRRRVLRSFYLSFLALFFYIGVELGVSNWVASPVIRCRKARCCYRCSGPGCWLADLACRLSITGRVRT